MSIDRLVDGKTLVIDKAIEKYIPRKFQKSSILFKVCPPEYTVNLETINRAISEPIWEFLDRGGKRWRPALFLIILEAFGKNPNDLIDFAIIPEVIHNGTLMVDDVEDSSEMRRGKPSTYRIFGIDIAINAGNSMYFLPLLPLIKYRNVIPSTRLAQMFQIYVQEMMNLSIGQAMDIAWHRSLAKADDIVEKDYLQMCAYKTGTLARMAAKMAAVLADADIELTEKIGHFAENIGIAFQMQDDILDLTGSEFTKGKGGFGNDITEGKRTLMVIDSLNKANAKDRERLISILNMHTSDTKLRNEAIIIMKKYGSIDYVARRARKMVKKSWTDVEKLLPDSKAKRKLEAFAMFLIERKI